MPVWLPSLERGKEPIRKKGGIWFHFFLGCSNRRAGMALIGAGSRPLLIPVISCWGQTTGNTLISWPEPQLIACAEARSWCDWWCHGNDSPSKMGEGSFWKAESSGETEISVEGQASAQALNLHFPVSQDLAALLRLCLQPQGIQHLFSFWPILSHHGVFILSFDFLEIVK